MAMILVASPVSHVCLMICEFKVRHLWYAWSLTGFFIPGFLAALLLHLLVEVVLPMARRIAHACVALYFSLRSYCRDFIRPLNEAFKWRRTTNGECDSSEVEDILKDNEHERSET